MLKVNSAALHDAEIQLREQFRATRAVAERMEASRRALLANDGTFLPHVGKLDMARIVVEYEADRLRELADLADSLLTMYARCERECSEPTIGGPASAVGELFRGAADASGRYVDPAQIQYVYNDLIEPLISNV